MRTRFLMRIFDNGPRSRTDFHETVLLFSIDYVFGFVQTRLETESTSNRIRNHVKKQKIEVGTLRLFKNK